MRRRSNTIHAKNFTSYLDASMRIEPQSLGPLHPKPKRLIKRSPDSNLVTYEDISHHNQENIDINGNDYTMDQKNTKAKASAEEEWDNFDFDCEIGLKEPNQLTSGASSLALSENTAADTDYSEESDGNKNSILKRIMVIGLNDIGKRSLINSIFECEEPEENKLQKNQIMDLVMKTEQEEGKDREIRYQFWIRGLFTEGKEKNMFEHLFKTYYKNVSLFIFVYSINDKNSLNCLDEIIETISKEVPAEKFTTALLGTKSDLEQEREVTFFDGISLQEKHNITFFIETNSEDKSLKEKLIKLMNEHEEVVEKVEREKRSSLLSIE